MGKTHLKLAFPSVPWTKEYESPKACTNLISSQLNFGFDPWFSFVLLEIDEARESGTDPANAVDTKNARNFMIVWSKIQTRCKQKGADRLRYVCCREMLYKGGYLPRRRH
jgi:hypothetical protein